MDIFSSKTTDVSLTSSIMYPRIVYSRTHESAVYREFETRSYPHSVWRLFLECWRDGFDFYIFLLSFLSFDKWSGNVVSSVMFGVI